MFVEHASDVKWIPSEYGMGNNVLIRDDSSRSNTNSSNSQTRSLFD